jgi:hypothetical protein
VLGPSPFALTNSAFSLRAVALAAGRAPLGGPRESVLAALVAARLAVGALPAAKLTPAQRATRADHARTWIGTIALPQVPKVAALRAVELTAKNDLSGLAAALAKVTDVTAPYLDRAARSELESLGAKLRA